MSRSIGLLLIAGCVFTLASLAGATPSAFTWHCEQLLGANSEFYFCLIVEHVNPGSMADYTERLRIHKVRQTDLSIVEDVLIRETHFRDTSAYRVGFWVSKEAGPESLDISAYLRSNEVSMAFSYGSGTSLVIDTAGLFFEVKSTRARILSRQELLSQIPELGESPRVLHEMGMAEIPRAPEPRNHYYIVQSGHAGFEENWREDLLVIPKELLNIAANTVREARSTDRR